MASLAQKSMIVKKRDKYGNYHYYDFSTKNISFRKLANDLKNLGVKNYYFMLEIYDVSLIKINPFEEDKDGKCTLSKDSVDRITAECTRNPWYYLREISRIPAAGAPRGIPYEANRGNIAQAWCILHDLDSWLNLPRQKGKTQSAIAMQSWFYNFGTARSTFIFVNKDVPSAKENLNRLKSQIDLLPSYLRFKFYTDDDGKVIKGKDNATEVSHPITLNKIILRAGGASSYEKAVSLARGFSAQFLHYDEVEFTPHIQAIIENSVSTFEEAAKSAREHGSHAARIFTSTPGDLDTEYGVEAERILDKTVKWYDWSWTDKKTGKVHPALYDMSRDKILEYINAQGSDKMGILYIEYQYYQIGLSEDWLVEQAKKIGNNLTVRRELLLQRLHGSSLSPFDQEDIEYITTCQRNPIDELWLLDYYKFDIYKELNPRIPYIVGIDCASGGGSETGDNNAITIINPYTLEPDAEFECSYIGETKFEQLIIDLVVNHIPKACVVIERNSMGDGIIDHLLESQIQMNLYCDKYKDLLGDKLKQTETVESMLKKEATKKRYYGVYTGVSSRNDMMAILSRHVAEYKEKFVTHNIIRDLSRLVRTRTGKIAAGPGFHDDSIMSYLIALYVYYYGSNLTAFGIYPGMGDGNATTKRREVTLDTVDKEMVNQSVIKQLTEERSKVDAMNKKRQEENQYKKDIDDLSRRLKATGLINGSVYQNTDMDAFYDNNDSIDIDFFREMNDY